VTEPDPNETARMPTPGAATTPSDEGLPAAGGSVPVPDAAGPADPVPADPIRTEPSRAEPPPPATPPSPAPTAWSVPPRSAEARRRHDPDSGRTASIVFGLIVLAIGLWFFAEHTLGLELPRIRWSQFWPVLLIGLGVWIVLGSARRGSR
jgi:hypothetical protein